VHDVDVDGSCARELALAIVGAQLVAAVCPCWRTLVWLPGRSSLGAGRKAAPIWFRCPPGSSRKQYIWGMRRIWHFSVLNTRDLQIPRQTVKFESLSLRHSPSWVRPGPTTPCTESPGIESTCSGTHLRLKLAEVIWHPAASPTWKPVVCRGVPICTPLQARSSHDRRLGRAATVQRCGGVRRQAHHTRGAPPLSDMPEIIGFKLKLIITHALRTR